MKFVPDAVGRSIAGLALQGQKHSPTLLLGAGVASMVGSTVLACRATLKLDEVVEKAKTDLDTANMLVEQERDDYSKQDRKRDAALIYTRGVVGVAKLYAPAVVLGGVGVVCLTKSHSILKERNAAITAAYVGLDKAFRVYRQRVVDKYGEEEDRHFRYGAEEIDIIDDETGKVVSTIRNGESDGLPSGYARWFDESSPNWTAPPFDEYNWTFLRNNQNWANDMLKSRGHLFLNEVYSLLGLEHTSAGSIVGWVYERDNPNGDNFVDFGCWGKDDGQPLDFFNGREGGVLLDFNVDGPIWDLIDARRTQSS
jgi:hypothetical protein